MTLFRFRVRNGQEGRFWTLTSTHPETVGAIAVQGCTAIYDSCKLLKM